MNSKLLNFVYRIHNPQTGKVFAEIKPSVVKKLPICRIQEEPSEKSRQNGVIQLADKMLELHKKFLISKTPQEKIALERQIMATDQQIDRLVYELYGLNEKEIEIIEK